MIWQSLFLSISSRGGRCEGRRERKDFVCFLFFRVNDFGGILISKERESGKWIV